MQVYLLLILIFLVGCGAGLDLPGHDPAFNPVREQFVKDASFFSKDVNTTNINIAFGNPRQEFELFGFINLSKDPGESEGVCLEFPQDSNEFMKLFYKSIYGKYSGHKVIIIDDSNRNLSAEELETLVYHELGHCAMNLPHKENQKIMKSAGRLEGLGVFRYFYLKEMFQGDSVHPVIINSLNVEEIVEDEYLELIYSVNYTSFGTEINSQLYFDHRTETYRIIFP